MLLYQRLARRKERMSVEVIIGKNHQPLLGNLEVADEEGEFLLFPENSGDGDTLYKLLKENPHTTISFAGTEFEDLTEEGKPVPNLNIASSRARVLTPPEPTTKILPK